MENLKPWYLGHRKLQYIHIHCGLHCQSGQELKTCLFMILSSSNWLQMCSMSNLKVSPLMFWTLSSYDNLKNSTVTQHWPIYRSLVKQVKRANGIGPECFLNMQCSGLMPVTNMAPQVGNFLPSTDMWPQNKAKGWPFLYCFTLYDTKPKHLHLDCIFLGIFLTAGGYVIKTSGCVCNNSLGPGTTQQKSNFVLGIFLHYDYQCSQFIQGHISWSYRQNW